MGIDDTSRYLELVREKPPPTRRQLRAFARFLAGDHSWYKKLPLRGSGEPFFVFLDPTVHTARIKRTDGTFAARDVVEELKEDGPLPTTNIELTSSQGTSSPGSLDSFTTSSATSAARSIGSATATGDTGTGVRRTSRGQRRSTRRREVSASGVRT